ncbi:hypothetical protein E4T38_05743 [Aureobasidium subglaciale]|nr:hypothetical protein E4T38_05743 [Aureobasidium subglaciale]KAI5221154.1 hypothetical protein E4T40_05620 [Aureobasidium subglaciale]KAI5224326.1 hypothetical protein E4T41_05722 [Aureobasidium subglaciale]KAI5261023.1 hypothetical protein E4T46_05497 [Aureobasidium subglaciale]
MGKGLRSSTNKVNNRKLKKNVFGPVEKARTQRLSEKLQELASQPKPPKVDMEVEESSGEPFRLFNTRHTRLTARPTDSKQAASEAKAANANGALNALAIPVPKSLAHQCSATTAAASMNVLTAPPTAPLDISDFSKPSIRSAHRRYADEQLFFHLLGVSTDIHGFDTSGNICLGFGSDSENTAMEVDLTNEPRSSWIKAEKRAKEGKRDRIAKKQKRKVINQMTFKKNPRTGKK